MCRELPKVQEELLRGRISEILERLKGRSVKGECTVVVAGKDEE